MEFWHSSIPYTFFVDETIDTIWYYWAPAKLARARFWKLMYHPSIWVAQKKETQNLHIENWSRSQGLSAEYGLQKKGSLNYFIIKKHTFGSFKVFLWIWWGNFNTLIFCSKEGVLELWFLFWGGYWIDMNFKLFLNYLFIFLI